MEFSQFNHKSIKKMYGATENIEKWYDWEEDLKNITLNGGFKVLVGRWNSKEYP